MTERLPIVGSDNNAWGTVLNGFLGVTLDTDGTPKASVLATALGFGATTWTPTNVTTDRAFDANTVPLDELADIVGTLIADLQALNVLG